MATQEMIERPVSELLKLAAPYNPRKISPHDFASLRLSLAKFGAVEPVVVNARTNRLVGGHQRLKAADAEGFSTFPAVEVDLSETEERQLNIALNRIAGEWDEEKLIAVLDEIEAADGDLALTGFDDAELVELLGALENEETTGDEENEDPDDIPDSDSVDKRCEPGDLWILGSHRLLCGDSLRSESIVRVLDGATVGCVFTDPPYGMGLDPNYDNMHGGDFHRSTGNRFRRVSGDDSVFDPTPILEATSGVKEQFWWGADYYRQFLPLGGSWVVWDKRSNDSGMDLDKVIGSSFELCWSKSKHRREIARVLWSGWNGMTGDDAGKRVHPTQKPIALVDWFFGRWAPSSAQVFDPFLGSGATLLACEKFGRTCLGIELDPKYCDVILARWEKFTGLKAVRDAE